MTESERKRFLSKVAFDTCHNIRVALKAYEDLNKTDEEREIDYVNKKFVIYELCKCIDL